MILSKMFGSIALLFLASSVYGVSQTSSLQYGESGRVDTFDPFTIHESSGQRLTDLLFDSLISVSPGGEYTPSLAKSWAINKSGSEVTFTLRTDTPWHDGKSRLTPEDIITTIRLITAEKSEIPNKERFHVLKDAQKVSPSKVVIRLKRSQVDPLRSMMFKIVPHHLLGSTPALLRSGSFAKSPVGTGPYKFVKASNQGEVLLAANDSYYDGAPQIKQVVMKSYADQNVMAQSLMFNSLDLVTYVSPRDLGEIQGDNKLSVIPYDALSFSFFAMNNEKAPLNDKRVRQAIGHAVNRAEMLEAFFQSKGKLISGPFPPTSWAYNLDVKPLAFEVDRAKALLSAAGLKDANGDGLLETAGGKEISLVFAVPLTGESEMIKRIVLAFQAFLGKVGLKVDLQFMDWLVWKEKVLGRHDYDLTIASWSFDDASNITSLFHSSSAVPWGNNFVQFKNVEVDGLLTEAEATNDFDKRRAIYQKLHAILADEAPYTYLWTLMHHAAHSTKLSGVRVEPFAFFRHVVSWRKEGGNESKN